MWIDAQLTRSLLAPTENSRLAIRVRELAESRAEASMLRLASCAGSNGTCTTVRRPGWSP